MRLPYAGGLHGRGTAMMLGFAALILIGVVAFIVQSWSTRREYRMRSAALAECARSLGMEHSCDKSPKAILNGQFSLAKKGASPGNDMIWGHWRGLPVSYVEYYQITGPPVPARFDYPVTCATLNIEVPYLRVDGNVSIHQLTKRCRNLVNDSLSERFDREFRVISKDSGFAEKLIDTGMMAWLLSSDTRLTFEVYGRLLVVYSAPTYNANSTDPPCLFDAAVEFTAHIPAAVLDEYRLPAHSS
jgi:hypothetical protein